MAFLAVRVNNIIVRASRLIPEMAIDSEFDCFTLLEIFCRGFCIAAQFCHLGRNDIGALIDTVCAQGHNRTCQRMVPDKRRLVSRLVQIFRISGNSIIEKGAAGKKPKMRIEACLLQGGKRCGNYFICVLQKALLSCDEIMIPSANGPYDFVPGLFVFLQNEFTILISLAYGPKCVFGNCRLKNAGAVPRVYSSISCPRRRILCAGTNHKAKPLIQQSCFIVTVRRAFNCVYLQKIFQGNVKCILNCPL